MKGRHETHQVVHHNHLVVVQGIPLVVAVQDNHLVAAVLGIRQGAADLDTHVGAAGLGIHLGNHLVAAVLDSQQVEPENKSIQCVNNY